MCFTCPVLRPGALQDRPRDFVGETVDVRRKDCAGALLRCFVFWVTFIVLEAFFLLLWEGSVSQSLFHKQAQTVVIATQTYLSFLLCEVFGWLKRHV